MNNYQPNPASINVSPYQQNIDIIKGFFKKPIVLVYGILSLLLPIASAVVSCFLILSSTDSYYYSNSFGSGFSSIFTVSLIIMSTLISIIPAVCWVLIHSLSKNNKPNVNPLIPFKIIWVFAIVGASALGFLALIILFASLTGIAAMNGINYYGKAPDTAVFLLVIMAIVVVIVFGVLLFYYINRIRYYGSVKNSMQTIYLKRKGAMITGVFDIVLSSITFLFSTLYGIILFSILFDLSTPSMIGSYSNSPLLTTAFPLGIILYFLVVIVSSLPMFLHGIIAIKYASYIKNISNGTNQQFNANQPYSNPVVPPMEAISEQIQEPNPYNSAPAQAPVNENPYTNPQQINPQEPQAPVEQNPYANPQPPVANNAPVVPTPTPTEGVCPNCGSSVFRSDIFCNNCGTKLK